jgi:Fe2+ transport protein
MRRRGVAVACAVAVVPALGCGEDRDGEVNVQTSGTDTVGTTTSATTPSGPTAEVPEGVAAQYRTIEEEVRAEGGEQNLGPWRIAYIVEPAEGWFEPRGGRLRWRAPGRGETNHIEILPIEAETGRLVPDVPVTLEVLNAQGKQVARKRLAFYHAEFFHYAENFALPANGSYTLRATIGAPAFRRHGERTDTPALTEKVTARFKDVEIDTEE